MKVGISFNIDVTKLKKDAFYVGKKGKYVTLDAFVDLDEQDEFGKNGGVRQNLGKDNRDVKHYVGNAKVYWRGDGQKQEFVPKSEDNFNPDEDVPF